ncbi:MAG: preprotein translocase subunit SecF [candidate division Zixibacteria bacterium DG_27]|nr:MAG: preprotein translocase subunit SecF [candidate division Zixibacteria bacterium DG_27]
MLRIIGKTNIDFIGKRHAAFVFSGILVLLGLTALVLLLFGKGNLGIDFAGGAMIRGSFENPVSVADLRGQISSGGFADAHIIELKGADIPPNSFLIRTKSQATEGELLGDKLLAAVRQGFPGNKFKLDSIEDIGPAVGETLQKQARWAILLSLVGILIYIWIRFEFRFGVAATVATFHDVLTVLGIFLILNKEISLLVISALLTLAGYSLTDTVVVYDRIRENLKLFRKRGDFASTINTSINDVLSRTLVTSLSTLGVLVVLLILGGEVLHDFAFALILGILVGTYSSVFVASPVIVEWEKRSPRRYK